MPNMNDLAETKSPPTDSESQRELELKANLERLARQENPQPERRHPGVVFLLQFFEYSHLRADLQEVSRPFGELAQTIASGPQNAETTAALRHLLEAKDCAVRARLAK